MQWDKIDEEIELLDVTEVNAATLLRIFSLLDLTSLNASDTEETMALLSEKAQTSLGHVACVCTYPRFTKLMADEFANTPVKVATVANFPDGTTSLESTLVEIGEALENGAQELDVVFPYKHYLAGEKKYAYEFVSACKAACGKQVKLKMILETGQLGEMGVVAEVSKEVLLSGADFIKTSTGWVGIGATLKAAATMLMVIKELRSSHPNQAFGFKASGGIKTIKEAMAYIQLADHIMGKDWVLPKTFRIGSSQLADELLKENNLLS